MTEPLHDVAHIHHAELLTPTPQQSLEFFTELFGMQIESRAGQSVFLRGWGETQPYGLKLTEAALPGLGHMALRAWSPEALARRVAAIEAVGLGDGWADGDHGHGLAYQFRDPDGHRMELLYEAQRYQPPEALRPRLKNVPQRHVDHGAAVKRLDHVNVLAADVTANRRFATDLLGFRLYEQVVLDGAVESGAWLSLTIAAHELIYVADHSGARGRLHHLAWFVDTREELLRAADLFLDADVPIEAAPSKHAVAQGMFLYVYEPGATAWRSPPARTSSMTPTTSRSCGRPPSGPAARPGEWRRCRHFTPTARRISAARRPGPRSRPRVRSPCWPAGKHERRDDMTSRAASDLLLVGSLPAESTEAALRASAEQFGDMVFALPDGETGPRRAWVGYERERLCRPHPDVVVVQETESPTGIPRHAYETPIFAVRDGVSELHWDSWPRIDDAIASYREFQALREQGVIAAGLRFQVGLPFPSSALNAFKAAYAVNYPIAERGFEDLVARELQRLTT